MKMTTATPLSRGEFGALVGLPRILSLLKVKGVQATFFTPSHTAAAFPAQTRQIIENGHEIALHGYCHETPVGVSREQEADLLDRSLTRLKSVLGSDFTPLGYRSPAWDLSEHSIALMEARGLLYDSSMMADDFRPYLARKGYVANEDQYDPGKPSAIVELPVAWELDDFPHFVFLNKPMYLGLRTPDEVFALWKEEFDFCHSLGDGVFTLTLHPQVIGRGPRLNMLSRLIDHMQARSVTFSTASSEAQRQSKKLSGH